MASREANERQVFMVTSAKKTGKSTLVRSLIEAIPGDNILVFKEGSKLYDPAFEGYPITSIYKYGGGRAIINGGEIDYQEFLWMVYRHYRNGVLVIDDAANFEENNPSKPLKRIMIDCRHLGIDVFLVFHSLEDTPIKLFTYTDVLVLGFCGGNFEYKIKKLPEKDEILSATRRIANNYRQCRCEGNGACKCGKRYTREVIKLS